MELCWRGGIRADFRVRHTGRNGSRCCCRGLPCHTALGRNACEQPESATVSRLWPLHFRALRRVHIAEVLLTMRIADRRLTVSAVSASRSSTSRTARSTLLRGDTLAITLSGLGEIERSAESLVYVKSKRTDPDSAAILLVEETSGLLVLVGAEPAEGETAMASVEEAESDAVTVLVSASASRKLPVTTTGVWDVQVRDEEGNVRTLVHGALKITADVTQTIE